jgi:Molybdopterin-binding domain of aldehyde dehydrogenase
MYLTIYCLTSLYCFVQRVVHCACWIHQVTFALFSTVRGISDVIRGTMCSYGAAILDACTQLNERLAPLREKMGKDAAMADIAAAAWMSRIDLCAHGFYKTPDITGMLLAPFPLAGLCYVSSG